MAAYNAWANRRLYAAAKALPDEAYRRPAGVFFSSLHGTLNHLLVADRIWLRRLTGQGDDPGPLDGILFERLDDLHRAREVEDRRIARWPAPTRDSQVRAAPRRRSRGRRDRTLVSNSLRRGSMVLNHHDECKQVHAPRQAEHSRRDGRPA